MGWDQELPDQIAFQVSCAVFFPCRHVIGSDRGMSLGPLERGFHPTSYLDTKHVPLHRFQLERDPWCTGHTLLERRETCYFMCKNIRNYYMKVDHSILLKTKPNLHTWFAWGRFKICQKLHLFKVGFVHMNFTLQKDSNLLKRCTHPSMFTSCRSIIHI